MRALNVLLSILVSLLLGALVLEGGLRLIGKGPTVSPLTFDADTGWSKKPGFSQTKTAPEFIAHIELNEFGLRDDPMASAAKPGGVFRILALGDSFTYGFSVEREDLFVDKLESMFRASGRNVEVLNVGTEGWDTAQQAAWLEANGAAFQPDLVLLLPYENDLYWNSQLFYQTSDGPREKPRYGADGTLEARTLADTSGKPWHQSWALTKWMRAKDKAGEQAQRFTPAGASRPIAKELGPLLDPAPAFMAQVEQHSLGALLAIRRVADKLGADVLVAPIPPATLYEEEWAETYNKGRGLAGLQWSGDRGVDMLIDLSQRAGLDTVDSRPALTAARAAGEPIYYLKDWHLNPTGNGAFAGFLRDEITRRGNAMGLPAADEKNPLASLYTPTQSLPTWLMLFMALYVGMTSLYYFHYGDEPKWQPPLKVFAMLGTVFAVFMGVFKLQTLLPPSLSTYLFPAVAVGILGFVFYKLGNRISTIVELLSTFIRRGHWYLMPLVVILLTIGSLLVVAASSPFVAPFIYTLF